MPTRNDPRPVAVSNRVYRGFLRIYPRRFRLQYREEMALVFRDSCRDAYRERGWQGLVATWRAGLRDLATNVPQEVTTALVEETPVRPWGRTCAGCTNEVAPDWTTCRFCGIYLTSGTTYPTRVPRLRYTFGDHVRKTLAAVMYGPPTSFG